jgi:hypothetical protein
VAVEQYTGVASSLLAFNTAGAMAIKGEARREILPLGQALFQQTTPPALTPAGVERPGWPRGEEMSRGVRGKARGRLLTDRQ